jgi:CDP-diacylglycerol--serine O-phosphatidyltransferase
VKPPLRSPDVRRVVVLFPSGLTLANLFFGVFAIVTASRGDPGRAAWYIVIAAMCDGLDGRVARATRSASRFGEELDSLVDAISFGLAPAMITYFAVLRHEGWDWILVFLFSACAVLRLARFNIEQAGKPKKGFIGLPSPAAGGTLASYYWFTETPLYNQFLSDWPWQQFVKFLMALLAGLMISGVPYPTWPTFSVKTAKGILGLALFVALLVGFILLPKEFFFPVGVAYVLFGVLRAVFLGLVERPDDEHDDAAPSEHVVPLNSGRHARQMHRRHSRHNRPQGPDAKPE